MGSIVAERQPLGIKDGKEYYYDLRPVVKDDTGLEVVNTQYKKIVWRVHQFSYTM